jgi:hypothetical protein
VNSHSRIENCRPVSFQSGKRAHLIRRHHSRETNDIGYEYCS